MISSSILHMISHREAHGAELVSCLSTRSVNAMGSTFGVINIFVADQPSYEEWLPQKLPAGSMYEFLVDSIRLTCRYVDL